MLAFPVRTVTPEDCRRGFQYRLDQHPGDRQMALGLQISRGWKRLWDQRTISQDDLDRLLEQFSRYEIGGTCVPTLWDYVADWGRKLGLSVPDYPPWWPPPLPDHHWSH